MVNYETIKLYYDMGLFPDGIKVFVQAGYITPEQYKEITGEDYA